MTDHDGTYHQVYTDPLMVADLLTHFVNEPWVKDLDFTRMQRVNTKFHIRFLPKREGDVVWQIPTRSGGVFYLLVMLEFQSTVNWMMAVRMVAYANLLWLQLIHEKKLSPHGPLPPIFPAVIYNGEQPWLAPVRLRDLIGLPEGSPLWKFQPDGQFFLLDQGRLAPDLLEQMEAVSALLFRIDQCKDPEKLPCLAEELSLKSPIHDVFGSSGYFNNIFSERVKWHNYETALTSICDRLSGSLIYDQGLDLIMALWEMFVYSHDSWFCRQGGDIKYILYQTLDKDIQIAHRACCIQEMLRKLGNVNANLVKVWRNEYLCYTQTETRWFIRLVKQPCPKTILQLS